MLLLAAIGPLR